MPQQEILLVGQKSIFQFLFSDIWLSSYDHLTDAIGQAGQLSTLYQRKDACFLLNKKEALSGLIQVNDYRCLREERWTSREILWFPVIGTWGYPIQAYTCLGAMSVMFPV